MLKVHTRADLQRIVDEGLEESLVLEYKASPALDRQSKAIDELCKDVSAMANSAGGQIIYGIEEDKLTHKPIKIGHGVSDPKLTREWIEQIILSRVQPRIQKLSITRISLDQAHTRFAFVLATEATTIGAHQAPDKKYYKRFELSAVPMEDYEIRDVGRRASVPEPFVTFSLPSTLLEQFHNSDTSKPIAIGCRIGNRSREPAYYTVVTIGIDAQLELVSVGTLEPTGIQTEDDGHTLAFVRAQVGIPESFPIFREASFPLIKAGTFSVAFNLRLHKDESLIRCYVRTPGFSSKEDWILKRVGASVRLIPPAS